ncbi:hypothetical protein Tco_0685615 [Tanacetum coccineum]
MADLIFADSHNMVAYLEKSEDNADFAEIDNFLNASPIRFLQQFLNNQIENLAAVFNDEYDTPSHTKKVFANMRRQVKDFSGTVTPLFAIMLIQSQAMEEPIPIVASSSQPKMTQKHRTTKRKATEISQSSGPTTLIADETVHEERGDSVERVATTATSLDAEHGSGGSPRRQDTMGDRPAQTRVLDLENVKDAQALEIKKLKKRVKKLESKKKSRTPQLKRRLFKVRIKSSVEKSLDDQEDTSKPGRNEIGQDEGISWFQEDSETQGRYGHDIGVNTTSTSITTASINITTAKPVTTASAPVTTAGVSVSTVEPSTPPPTTTTTTPIEDEDLTISQTLIKMKSEKSKAKGVTMQEPSESGTRVRVPPPQIDPKDKGKTKMVEPKKPKKKKDQIEYDADVAQTLLVELDEEAILKREKEEEASKAANIAEWDDNMAGYKHTQLKNKSFEEIQMLFEKEMKRVNIFVDMDAELVKGSETIESEVDRAVPKLAAGSSKRDAEEELDQESSKRQKTGESSELAEEPRDKEADELSQEELQQMMIIVPEQGMNVEALQTKYPIIDWEIYTEGTRKYWKIIRVGNHTEVHHFFDDMLKAFDRDDLVMLWSLVKEKFNSTEPTDDKEREIWVELKRLFKPDTDDEEGNRHLHAGREGVSIVKRNSYIDAGRKALGGSR